MTSDDQTHLISDDPDFRAWYVAAGIEKRMSEPVHGRDHETVMKDLQDMLDELNRKHDEETAAGGVASRSRS